MRRIADGDNQAYRTMMTLHLNPLYRFSVRLLGSPEEAEEVIQETFLRAWQNAAEYAPRARLTTWLHRIAHNLAIDRLRKRRDGSSDALEQLQSSQRPSELLERKQLALRVQGAIAELPERQRAALLLVHEQGLSGSEAAEVLGCKLDALESLLARARRKLRDQLRGSGEDS